MARRKMKAPKGQAGDKPSVAGDGAVAPLAGQEVLASWRFDRHEADAALATAREVAKEAAQYEAGYESLKRNIVKATFNFVTKLFDVEALMEAKAKAVNGVPLQFNLSSKVDNYLKSQGLPPIHFNSANPFLGIYQDFLHTARVEAKVIRQEDKDEIMSLVSRYATLSEDDKADLKRLENNRAVDEGRWGAVVAAAIDMGRPELLDANPKVVVKDWTDYRRKHPEATIALRKTRPGPQKGASRASVKATPTAETTDATAEDGKVDLSDAASGIELPPTDDAAVTGDDTTGDDTADDDTTDDDTTDDDTTDDGDGDADDTASADDGGFDPNTTLMVEVRDARDIAVLNNAAVGTELAALVTVGEEGLLTLRLTTRSLRHRKAKEKVEAEA